MINFYNVILHKCGITVLPFVITLHEQAHSVIVPTDLSIPKLKEFQVHPHKIVIYKKFFKHDTIRGLPFQWKYLHTTFVSSHDPSPQKH